jgi:chromosome partitioning protein
MTDLTRSAVLAARLVLIPVQPSPYDVWACAEVVDILKEASVFTENMKSVFVINRKIANTGVST